RPRGANGGDRDRRRPPRPSLRTRLLGGRRGGGARVRTRGRAAGRRRARQGLAVGRPRARRGRACRSAGSVTRVLIAALIALIASILIGPRFIAFLRRNEFGQHIREEGPEHHFSKAGTPTMGGLLILLAATIGFLADFVKLTHRRSLGLSGRWKLLLLAGITAVVAIVANHLQIPHNVYLPIANANIPLSYAWYPFLFLVIAGTSNGTNLADGVDGLAAGTGIIAIFTFTAMNVVSYVRSGTAGHRN